MAEPVETPDPDNDPQRRIAESFGTDAERYERSRPRYPRGVAEQLLAGVASPDVLDVGIGTGISARDFHELGARVIGVEADERMAQLARADGFEVEVSRFESWDPAGRLFDAVIAGQSWHWIDPVAGAVKAAQALRPSGRLAPFWNVGQPEPEICAEFAELYRTVPTGLPFNPWAQPALESYERIFERVVDGIRAAGAFRNPRRLRFDWQSEIGRDAWLDQVPTMGGHSLIAPAALEQLLDGMGRAIDAHGGSFTMSFATIVIVAARQD